MMKLTTGIFYALSTISAIGAINWGLVEFLKFNLVTEIAKHLHMIPHLEAAIYGIIALSGILVLLAMIIK